MSPIVQSFFHAGSNTWSHVLSAGDGSAAAIIDPVLDFDPASGRVSSESVQAILACVHSHRLNVHWILETHAHADHLTAAAWLRRQLQSEGMPARTGIGRGIVEVQAEFKARFNLGAEFAADGSDFDQLFEDGDLLPLGEWQIAVMRTPGHTADGVSYRLGDAVFVGDTLFSPAAGTGRCDFPGGDASALFRSIQRLYLLPEDTRVFLCHDYPPQDAEPRSVVSLVEQRSGNAQIRRNTSEAEFVARRTARDASLAPPRLLWPALQVNIRAGRLPAAESNGARYLRIPLSTADD